MKIALYETCMITMMMPTQPPMTTMTIMMTTMAMMMTTMAMMPMMMPMAMMMTMIMIMMLVTFAPVKFSLGYQTCF